VLVRPGSLEILGVDRNVQHFIPARAERLVPEIGPPERVVVERGALLGVGRDAERGIPPGELGEIPLVEGREPEEPHG
jgi:hypothetical protein